MARSRTPAQMARRKARRAEVLQREFCFIHINKCGGTSVETALGLPRMHDTAQRRRAKIGPERWAASKTFALVRHPFARAASQFRYRLTTNRTGLADEAPGLNDWVRRAYGDKDPEYYNRPRFFAPCLDWLTDENGEIIVELVVKLEEIDRAWPRIEEYLGVKAELGRHNVTAHGEGPRERLDEASREILRAHFAADFEAFGYDPFAPVG